MRSIFRKELASFFSSLVGYVALGFFLIGCWLVLWVWPDINILDVGYANLDPFFETAPYLLLLLIPAVTMRMFADGFRGGTIEWPSPNPPPHTHILPGPYFAAPALA